MSDEAWKQTVDKSSTWIEMPLDKLPTGEARKFVDIWRFQFQQRMFLQRVEIRQMRGPLRPAERLVSLSVS